MQRPCEVCDGLAKLELQAAADKPKVRRVLVGERIVALCEVHAAQVKRAGTTDVDTLRELFPEPSGRRSLVGRRSPLDRRVFPPRPEGRRRSGGRRADDARD
ncbi:MAG: hypothetical protein U0263_24480 [Polyangiaceae bacterium]